MRQVGLAPVMGVMHQTGSTEAVAVMHQAEGGEATDLRQVDTEVATAPMHQKRHW